MPMVSMTARVALVVQDVGLLTETKDGESCYELRADVAMGDDTSLGQYGCVQPRDALSVEFLVVRNQLAVGGAVGPSVATVTVNGQPPHRDGPYFLAVLPTVPDGDVNIVATDQARRVVVAQQYGRALVTTPKSPASTLAPDLALCR